MFALADNGEQVVIRRRGKVSYMLEERLEEGRRQYREGNVTTCTTKEELNKFLETL